MANIGLKMLYVGIKNLDGPLVSILLKGFLAPVYMQLTLTSRT